MKRTLLSTLVLSLFLSIGVNAQTTIKWLTVEQAEQVAKKDGKNAKRIFIDCYTDWCGWCKKMDKDTFEEPLISQLMNMYFYSVKFNAEQRESLTVGGNTYENKNPDGKRNPHDYAYVLLGNRLSYPSYSILNSDLSIVTVVPGYYTPKDFEPMVVFLGGKYEAKYTWEEFQKIYEKDIKPSVMKELEKANKK